MLLNAFQLVKKTMNATRKAETKKDQPDLHPCKYPTSARADIYARAGSSSISLPSSPSGEDPVLQAGCLAATPTPLVAAGTALVKRGARRWERSDQQTAERCCKKKRNKNLSRTKSIWSITPTTKWSPSRYAGAASQVPYLFLIYVPNIKTTSL